MVTAFQKEGKLYTRDTKQNLLFPKAGQPSLSVLGSFVASGRRDLSACLSSLCGGSLRPCIMETALGSWWCVTFSTRANCIRWWGCPDGWCLEPALATTSLKEFAAWRLKLACDETEKRP